MSALPALEPGREHSVAKKEPVILIIDDDGFTRRALRNALKALACRLIEAGSGLDGLRMISQDPPSLVLLDVKMPVLSGAEVLREIRSSSACRELPVMAMSGSTDRHMVMGLIGMGISGFLVKPLFRDEVVARLKPLLDALQRGESPTCTLPAADAVRPCIVVAAADDDFRRFIRPLLDVRYEVIEATTGIAAYEAILRRAPAYAVLAEGLPLLSAQRLVKILSSEASDTRLLFAADALDAPASETAPFYAVIKRSFASDEMVADLCRAGILNADSSPTAPDGGAVTPPCGP